MRFVYSMVISWLWLSSPFSSASQIYQCGSGDDVVFQSYPCQELYDDGLTHVSAFDGWNYGMNILSVKREAQQRRLAMSPNTMPFHKDYNEKILNSQPDSRVYSYYTTVAGKRTRVTLLFTQSTQKLYKIESWFMLSQDSLEERKYFHASLTRQLYSNYGEYRKVHDYPIKKNKFIKYLFKDLFGSTNIWTTNNGNVIALSNFSPSLPSLKLVYQYLPLVEVSMNETTEAIRSKTNHSFIEDAGKF